MNEAIERAAQELFDAIWENVGRSWPRWNDGATDRQKAEARIAARAALASIREPTAQMLAAAAPAMQQVDGAIGVAAVHGYKLKWAEKGNDPPLKNAWRAMVDELLSEQWND